MTVNKDHYYRLASNLPAERIKAASALIQELEASSSKDDYKYAFNRLVNGLASGHDSARLGFSMCLTEVLKLINDHEDSQLLDFEFGPRKYLEVLELNLNKQIKQKNKGKNLRAFLFGMIFGIKSLINSEIIDFSENVDDQLFHFIVDKLFEIMLLKSWIREISIMTIIDFVNKSMAVTNDYAMSYILTKLSESNLLLSMDGLLFYLNIDSSRRNTISDLATLKTNWKNNDPLTKGNLPLLKDAIIDRNVSPDNDGDDDEEDIKAKNNKLQKGSWTSQLHCVWGLLLTQLMQNEADEDFSHSSKKQKNSKSKSKSKSSKELVAVERLNLQSFWSVFDETFFSANSSSERKHSGLQILQLTIKLPFFQPSFFEIILSDNLTRCIINHLSKKDRMLNKLCEKILGEFIDYCKMNQSRVHLLFALERHCLAFDRVTKTKTVKSLMSNFNEDELDSWCEVISYDLYNKLGDYYKKNKKEFNEGDLLSFMIDLYFNLIRGNKLLIKKHIMNEKGPFVQNVSLILRFFADLLFFNNEYEMKNMKKNVNDRLQSILSDLLEFSSSNLIDWSGFIVDYLVENEKNDKRLTLCSSEELKELETKSIDIRKQLNEGDDNDLLKCMKFLLSQGLLELYNGDSESFDILTDLNEISIKLLQDHIDNEIIESLIELMLSYLPQESGMKKKVAIIIWECITGKVNQSHIERLFEILATRENKHGMEELFNQAIEFLDDEDEERTEEEKDDDEEEEEDEKEEEEEEEDDDDDEEEDDEEEGSEEGDDEKKDENDIEEIEKSTTSALAKALNVSEFESKKPDVAVDESDEDMEDEGAEDDDDDDESVESMSDEQMMALDSTLSAIFQQRRSAIHDIKKKTTNGNERKMQAAEARKLMSLFKSRVLDLLEIFVDKEEKLSPKLLIIINIELLKLIKLTLDLKVGEKAHKLVKKLCKINHKKIEDEEKNDEDKDFEFTKLIEILRFSTDSKINALSQACSQVSIFIIKLIVKNDSYGDAEYKQNITKICEIYNTFLIDWAVDSTNKSSVLMFTDFINWLNTKKANKKVDLL